MRANFEKQVRATWRVQRQRAGRIVDAARTSLYYYFILLPQQHKCGRLAAARTQKTVRRRHRNDGRTTTCTFVQTAPPWHRRRRRRRVPLHTHQKNVKVRQEMKGRTGVLVARRTHQSLDHVCVFQVSSRNFCPVPASPVTRRCIGVECQH